MHDFAGSAAHITHRGKPRYRLKSKSERGRGSVVIDPIAKFTMSMRARDRFLSRGYLLPSNEEIPDLIYE